MISLAIVCFCVELQPTTQLIIRLIKKYDCCNTHTEWYKVNAFSSVSTIEVLYRRFFSVLFANPNQEISVQSELLSLIVIRLSLVINDIFPK